MSHLPPPIPPRKRLSPAMTFLMFVVGIVLLLPGLCSLIFGAWVVASLREADSLSGVASILPIWLFGLILGSIGVGLIVRAFRRYVGARVSSSVLCRRRADFMCGRMVHRFKRP